MKKIEEGNDEVVIVKSEEQIENCMMCVYQGEGWLCEECEGCASCEGNGGEECEGCEGIFSEPSTCEKCEERIKDLAINCQSLCYKDNKVQGGK